MPLVTLGRTGIARATLQFKSLCHPEPHFRLTFPPHPPMSAPAKTRILAHMNRDHRLAINDYLVHYGNVAPSSTISNVRLTDIALDLLTISFKMEGVDQEVTKPIPIEPPMELLSDSRVRLVAMAKEAAAARGFSHVQVNQFVLPNSVAEAAILAYLFAIKFKPEWLWALAAKLPVLTLFVRFSTTYANGLWLITLIAHVTEATFLLQPLLRKYRVPTDYRIEWTASVLLEGAFGLNRLKALIAEAEGHGRNV